MANAPKQKGTGGETELGRLLAEEQLAFVRTPPTTEYDLTNATPGALELEPLEVLATRPDRGQWLMTMRLEDFAALMRAHQDWGVSAYNARGPWETHVEVKRYARFAHHSIFERKFGR